VKSAVEKSDARLGLRGLLLRPLYFSAGAAVLLVVFHEWWFRFVTAGDAAAGLREAPVLVFVCTCFFLLSVLSGPVIRILYSEGRTVLANSLPVLGSILNLVAVLFCQRLGLKSLAAYICCMLAPPVLPLLYIAFRRIAAGVTKRSELSALLPSWGGHLNYTLFNFASILVLRVDIYVLSRVLSTEQLVAYISVQKIFSLAFMGPQTLLSTVHPKFSALYMQGQDSELRRTALKYAVMPNVILVCCALILVAFDREICPLISAQHLSVFGVGVIFAACLYYCVRVWTDAWATVLLATNQARRLLLPTLLQGAMSAPLLYWIGLSIGGAGGFLALVIAFILTTAWMAPLLVFAPRRCSIIYA
jgi:O-antigen/teichoic acid export membrane protein